MLRLSQTFGHLLIIIQEMFKTIVVFLFIFMLVLVTFSCMATLTLTSLENYETVFQALRTYIHASLGSFDLYMYNDLEGWRKYWGMALHVIVLLSSLILLLNLLIAVMTD